MRKLEEQERTVKVKVITDIICNQCGNTMGLDDRGCGMVPDPYSRRSYLGLLNGSVDGCFSSDHLIDTHRYRFSMCEECLVKLFYRFVIPPMITEYAVTTDEDTDRTITWTEDRILRRDMNDQHDPLEIWECSCEDSIRVTVGERMVHWYRNSMCNHETHEDGLVVLHLECMNLAGRGVTWEQAWKGLRETFEEQLEGRRRFGSMPGYLREPHWKVERRPADGWDWLKDKKN